MTLEGLEIELTARIASHPTVTGLRVPHEIAQALAPYVVELIEATQRAEREVCVKVAARMAHDAHTVRRYQRAAAMTQVAETLKRGTRE